MAIKEFNKATCRSVRASIDAKLAELGKELGISIKSASGGTYTTDNLRFKVECAVLNPSGEAQTKDAADFKRYAASFGLSPDDLGKTFSTWDKKSYTIIGLRPRSYKRPILAKRVDNGKVFKFAPEQIKQFLLLAK